MDVTPRENVYGHQQRLHWLRDHLLEGDRIVEFGCGTGVASPEFTRWKPDPVTFTVNTPTPSTEATRVPSGDHAGPP